MEVIDPAEPLFGKRFELLSVSRGDQQIAHVFVKYRGDVVLRLPLRATNLTTLDDNVPRAKLSGDAAQEFLSLVKEYDLCTNRTQAQRRNRSGKRSTSSTGKTSSASSKPSSRR